VTSFVEVLAVHLEIALPGDGAYAQEQYRLDVPRSKPLHHLHHILPRTRGATSLPGIVTAGLDYDDFRIGPELAVQSG